MEDDKINTDQLEKEKLLLEIEELRKKNADSEKDKAWEDYFKPIIPVFVTLIIAFVGWIITLDYNKSQIEIAQIDASLSYINIVSGISDSSAQLKRQAKTVIAPVLPPETSFNIAVEEVESNPNLLAILIRTFPEDFWEYLLPHIESYPRFLSYPDRSTINNYELFNFLEKKQLLNTYYQKVTSEDYYSSNRVFGLINYMAYIDSSYRKSNYISFVKEMQMEYQLLSTIDETSDNVLKADISKAASVIFDQSKSDKNYSELAAKFFWEGYDVSTGETPGIHDVERYIYREHIIRNKGFIFYPRGLPLLDSLSQSLYNELLDIDYKSFDIDRIETILFSYIQMGNIDAPTTPYLKPRHSLQIMKKVLNSLTTEKRRYEFSNILGGSGGNTLFQSIAFSDKEAGREYSHLLINWYRSFWNKDWQKPEFFIQIIKEYPEFKSKINKNWGVEID